MKDVVIFWLSWSIKSGGIGALVHGRLRLTRCREWPQLAQTSYQEPVQGFQMYQQQKWRTCGWKKSQPQSWGERCSVSAAKVVKDVTIFWLSWNWYTVSWVPATYLLPWVTATSADKLPGTCSRVPDVPVYKSPKVGVKDVAFFLTKLE